MATQIRLAVARDMGAIATIVNEHIRDGVAHFGDRPESADAWLAEWQVAHDRYPWYVAEQRGAVVGLAYAKRFNPRAAYDWTAEVSIYLQRDAIGKGIGTALYERLIGMLDAQGYRCLLAGITTPNDASVRLHERSGFVFLGRTPRVGYKHGAWRDVEFWQRLVRPEDDAPPAPIRTVDAVAGGV